MDKITVAVAQFKTETKEASQNYVTMERFVREARSEHHADLILFPEEILTGHAETLEEVQEYAVTLDSEYVQKFRQLSTELDIDIAFGLLERDGEKVYNSLVLCEPDGNFFWYRKSHLTHMGCDCFVEKGNELKVVDTRFGKVGLMICYDMRFPEVSRCLALQGARMILSCFCQTGDPVNDGALRFLRMLPQARALENRVYILYSNWVGQRSETSRFLGNSHIVNIVGDILVNAGDTEGVVSCEIDLSLAENKDILAPWGDVYIFRDRRPDLYDTIVKA